MDRSESERELVSCIIPLYPPVPMRSSDTGYYSFRSLLEVFSTQGLMDFVFYYFSPNGLFWPCVRALQYVPLEKLLDIDGLFLIQMLLCK